VYVVIEKPRLENMKSEKRLTFKLRFKCKCGVQDSDKFLLDQSNAEKVTLLCMNCERKYVVGIVSRELK
jgi:hypothetical protein